MNLLACPTNLSQSMHTSNLELNYPVGLVFEAWPTLRAVFELKNVFFVTVTPLP